MASPSRPLALSRGPRAKPDILRRDRAPDLAGLDQRQHAGPAAVFQLAQAAPHQHAVLLDQRHDVGDGAERDQVEVVAQVERARPGELEQAVADLEDKPHAGQVIELPVLLRVDQGMHGGKLRG